MSEYPKDDELKALVDGLLGDKFTACEGHRCNLSQTGEPYLEVSLRINEFNILAPALVGIIMSCAGKYLYWRVTPGCEITKYEGETTGWKAYMRFLVSNNPVVYKSENDNPSFANSYYGRLALEAAK